jgi:hypothetical protein
MSRFVSRSLALSLLFSFLAAASAFAQDPPAAPPATPAAAPASEPIIVPAGTRLPLVLRNGINTRTAKQGDSVYFETAYPIAVNNRMAIPMGSFLRGEILEAKRPGRIKGRGEFRIALAQMTFPNGYTVELRATPSSVDRNGREGVDSEGKIKGPSSVGRDTAVVAVATAGGAYIGTLVGAALNGSPGRGALIGGGAAGLGALIAVLATRGPEAELPRGTTLDVVFDRPLILDAALLPANPGAGNDPRKTLVPAATDPRENLQDRREIAKRRLQQSLFRSFLRFPL